jgi:hypothetical protein
MTAVKNGVTLPETMKPKATVAGCTVTNSHAALDRVKRAIFMHCCSPRRFREIAGYGNGVFLVAQPTLDEPPFRRTVILITQLPCRARAR